jgi:2-phosphosulfolactate phosphatase
MQGGCQFVRAFSPVETPLRIDVALVSVTLDQNVTAQARSTYIVVDVIRATTTLTALFDRGCAEVLLAPGIEAARAARDALGDAYLLAGEAGGARPLGFDLGNSPSEIARSEVRGRSIIFATTNGTKTMRACQGGQRVLAGCLRNARAVCAEAVAEHEPNIALPTMQLAAAAVDVSEAPEATYEPDIVVVCSGRGNRPAYDDTLCAGYLVRDVERAAAVRNRTVELGEGARIALGVLEAAEIAGTLRDALAHSDAASAIERIGLGDDLNWCAATDTTEVVPALAGEAGTSGLLVVRAVL